MGIRFIFMLTRDDRTVEDAATHVAAALAAGLRHIGFKDIGLPFDRLKELNQMIKAGGATSYLEVVSVGAQSEVTSARAAVHIGVDALLGGVCPDLVLPIIAGAGIQYFPFAGTVSGHPSVLEGDIEEIVTSARALCDRDGVEGLDLLAYRSHTDVPALMKAVCEAVDKPVIMAGSIETAEQIAAVKASGAAGFTIGTAALRGDYPAHGADLKAQIEAIMKDVAAVNHHVSPHIKVNLSAAFGRFSEMWTPKIAGQINAMQIKLVKLSGEFVWHFHEREDELFLVHKGQLLMKFRDRDETIDEGEFIIVPHGVEHCPVALSPVCDVILMEPGSTVNTGNTDGARTVTDLEIL